MVDVYHKDDELLNAATFMAAPTLKASAGADQTNYSLIEPFTDLDRRSISRTLCFRRWQVKVLTDKNTTVVFDVDEVSQLNRSDGFGTFSGTFIAPSGGLNGMIQLVLKTVRTPSDWKNTNDRLSRSINRRNSGFPTRFWFPELQCPIREFRWTLPK